MHSGTEQYSSKAELRRNAQALLSIRRVTDLVTLLDCRYADLEQAAFAPHQPITYPGLQCLDAPG